MAVREVAFHPKEGNLITGEDLLQEAELTFPSLKIFGHEYTVRRMLPASRETSLFWEYLKPIFWGILFLAAVAVWLFIKRLPALFRSIRSASWPLVEGRIESTTVNAFAQQTLAHVGYSYRVDGELYSGYFAKQFADEQDAWDYIRPLKHQPVFVRYQPANTAISAVRGPDQPGQLRVPEKPFITRFLTRSLAHLLGVSELKIPMHFGVQNWPLSEGRIESSTVAQERESALWYLLPTYVSEIGYSYAVRGQYYSGQIYRKFFREQSARRFADKMRGKCVLIRYQPNSPEVSILRGVDQHSEVR